MKVPPHITALAFVSLSGLAAGQVINVDFDESSTLQIYQGLAGANDPAGATALWNRMTGSGTTTISGSNLLDSDGDPTTVGINFGINGSYLSAPGQQQLGTWEDLMQDYVYISASTPEEVATNTGTIFGLDAGKLYDVYLYGQGNNFLETYSEGQNTLFTIGGVSKQTSWDGVEGGDGLLVEGIEYVKFSVLANPSGQITFNWANVVAGPGGNVATDSDGHGSRFGVLNGLQIVDVAAVPEPASAFLAAVGLLGLLRRRR